MIAWACAAYGLDPAPLLAADAEPGAAFDRLTALLVAAIDDVNARGEVTDARAD